MTRLKALMCMVMGLIILPGLRAQGAEPMVVDCATVVGTFKPLHGVNGGPLNYGETIDLTAAWREAGIPLTRLHDCEWPSGRIADFHSLFPDLNADPADPKSYRFVETDEYLRAIASAGARVVFRLGESIEHSATKVHVHPPADFDKWTAACIGIVRRYEAKSREPGFPQIAYWEIWNEPENQPAMWTGTNEEFYRLFATAARGLKREFPHLKIGGPALGATGEVADGEFLPNSFTKGFIDHCRREQVPLDFFSWHTYTDQPASYAIKARALRAWLDEQGYAKTELHLNEWNYLPKNDWSAISRTATPAARTKWFAEQGSATGAAFAAYVLLDLQESPIEVANFFSGDTGPFGLFERYGQPKKTYYAFQAFHRLLATPERLATQGESPNRWQIQAGRSKERDEVQILVANFDSAGQPPVLRIENLPWKEKSRVEIWQLDGQHDLSRLPDIPDLGPEGTLAVPRGPAVQLIRLRRTESR
jgi:xylan 1,4-beta-xylosidase